MKLAPLRDRSLAFPGAEDRPQRREVRQRAATRVVSFV